jgi:tryptophan synthase alpha chain
MADQTLGLMGHVIADYPSAEAVREMIGVMAGAGVGIIEIQFPFSEPMADGPYFLAANHKALAQGVGYEQAMTLAREMSAKYPQVQFVAMSYLNVVYKRGYARFVEDARAAGLKGMIIPDLPLEHAGELETAATAKGLANVRLVAPNTPDARVQDTLKNARGFVYAVARSGVTGAKTELGQNVRELVARIRKHTPLPVAVGFGIRTAADVGDLRGVADYAIVGTASLKAFDQGGASGFQSFWKSLEKAARG